jgi:putative ABC transport system ATP-binding protein
MPLWRRLGQLPIMPGMASAAVEIRDLVFTWPGSSALLSIPRFEVARGERVFLHGPSGSGKSTLLGLVGGVQVPQRGMVRVLGSDLGALRPAQRDAFRAVHLGFVFQLFNLVPYLNVLENVLLPLRFSRERARRAGAAVAEARRLLAELGLGDTRLQLRKPSALSVGQQQRVAVARALLGRPELLVADEPTSALDAEARESFLALLVSACEAAGASVLFVSHDAALGRRFDRSLSLVAINRTPVPAAA